MQKKHKTQAKLSGAARAVFQILAIIFQRLWGSRRFYFVKSPEVVAMISPQRNFLLSRSPPGASTVKDHDEGRVNAAPFGRKSFKTTNKMVL
ncbi:hypothetical protein CCR94_15165 [Rhodoblastus sphagnicola]|uniref:Uncharacterized protein n=1 Tax=Rhodoblastus sphagnicola TaxID=333368 RepID=A0A2S6N497_9HYPH|nr:hypothetical protein [Rhodoblastus sphagnicola]MBB4200360.1 hypothetical protein [Rhodoblastus sphagnicola]PPQ29445.1 hypothetical protein CCR94_15165 [Rhodoblastus sphagnicola]